MDTLLSLSDLSMSDSALASDGAAKNGGTTEYDYLIKFLALGISISFHI